MGKDEVLALETRRQIYQAITRSPGLHLRELARSSGVALSTLRHHLRYMEERDVIVSRKDGQYTRYFPSRKLSRRDKEVLSVLRREKPRRILLRLLEEGGEAWYQELLGALAYPSSTLGLYLKELVERGIVERIPAGRTSRYRIVDPERLQRLLIEYEESFYDKWVDRVLEIVEEAPEPAGREEPHSQPLEGDGDPPEG